MSPRRGLRIGVLYCVIIRVVLVNSLNYTDGIPQEETQGENDNIWRYLVKNCDGEATIGCLKKSMYDYFDRVVDYNKTFELFTGVTLMKNNITFDKLIQDDTSNEIKDSSGDERSPLEEITDALRKRAVKFMMTHDMIVSLPESVFQGAALSISPRTFDGDGTLIKLDTVPAKGRIFFKKIRKFITSRLLVALLAIVLVIKLLAVKFLFFLPLVMGVAAAKKLLLKVLLFFFPVLAHLFKLCPYYSPTKLHHHQHHISHIHHLSHLPSLSHGVELDHPPPGYGHDHEFEHDHHDHHTDHQFDYYSDGPGLTDNRRKNIEKGKPLETDSWFGGQGQASFKRGTRVKPLTPTEIENMIRQAEKEATLKARLQEEQKRVESDNKRLQEQIKQLVKVQEKLRLQHTILKENSKLTAANILHTANIIPHTQLMQTIPAQIPPPYIQPPIVGTVPIYQTPYQSNIQPPPPPTTTTTTTTTQSPVYDPFYSPILEKIDKVLVDAGFNEEPCRERLICSMYKNPPRFSPYSNLISAELSRDAEELEKPTTTNAAVIRFYKYVQAARDGQDQRDCLRLYPSCPVNTES